jgi:hypothetical protein
MNILCNRFLAAIRLCNGPLDIKKRLMLAWSEHLDAIDPNELPKQLRQKFIGLRKAIYSREPLPQETAPQASIRKMSVHEAASHTDTIVALYAELMREVYTAKKHATAAEKNFATDGFPDLSEDLVHHLN